MKAVVLAAGKGVRMMPLTKDKPKALVEYRGKALIEWVLAALEKAGIERAGIVIGTNGGMVREALGERYGKTELEYFEQKGIGTGTAKSLESAAEFCKGSDFLCINSDIVVESALFSALMEKRGFDAVISVRWSENCRRFGVVKVDGSHVAEVIEKPQGIKSGFINIGAYRFSPRVFGAIAETGKSPRGEFELTDSINLLVRGGGSAGFVEWKGKWKDIGTIEDLKE